MKVPRNRYGNSLEAPRDPAWASHIKIKSGYIVRTYLRNGYKAYEPQWVTPMKTSRHYVSKTYFDLDAIPELPHRQIDFKGYFYPTHHSERATFEAKTPKVRKARVSRRLPQRDLSDGRGAVADCGSTIPAKATPLLRLCDNPVLDGQDLATSDVPLPSDRWHVADAVKTASGAIAIATTEDREIEGLRRTGVLYDDGERESGFSLDSIEHSKPIYLMRVVPRKKRAKQQAVIGTGVSHFLENDQPDHSEDDGNDGWSEILVAEDWEIVTSQSSEGLLGNSWVFANEISPIE